MKIFTCDLLLVCFPKLPLLCVNYIDPYMDSNKLLVHGMPNLPPLLDFEFLKSKYDASLFLCTIATRVVFVLVYVDDIVSHQWY